MNMVIPFALWHSGASKLDNDPAQVGGIIKFIDCLYKYKHLMRPHLSSPVMNMSSGNENSVLIVCEKFFFAEADVNLINT